MEPRHCSLLSWCFTSLFGVLAVLLALHAWSLRPSDSSCTARYESWTPIEKGLQHAWRTFPQLTLFTETEFFGSPAGDADKAWDEFLPSEKLPKLLARASPANASV